MYFTDVEIKNYGCISELKYQFRFDENGNPIPCVVIGENGKGKTLFLTNLVDSLVESKRKTFSGSISETNNNNYYKIGTKLYIRQGTSFSRVKVNIKNNDHSSKLIDIMSNSPDKDLNDGSIQNSEIPNLKDFKENGFSKTTNSSFTIKDFNESVILYYPVDRYYFPMWFNDNNKDIGHFEIDSSIRAPKSNSIVHNMLSDLKYWTQDIFLETKMQYIRMSDMIKLPNVNGAEVLENLPENIKNSLLPIQQDTEMQSIVKQILSCVVGYQVTHVPTFNRKAKNLGFDGGKFHVNDISQLSDGEMNLFCMFLNIVKDWDLNHNITKLSDISGVVIIDEADLGLHFDYAYRAFPALMKMFPKIQFIITTHSPFLLAGLSNAYGENVDIISMPDGVKVEDINSFTEVMRVQELAEKGISEIRETNEILRRELETLKSKDDRIIIYTEGKTDVKYLKHAFDLFPEFDAIKNRVEYYDIEHAKNTGDGELEKIYEYLQKGLDNNIKICMFDRDVVVHTVIGDYITGQNNVYKFSIPVPSNRNDGELISIEHYLTDENFSTVDTDGRHLFLAKEFNNKGISIDGIYMWKNAKKASDKGYNPLEIVNGSGGKKVYKIAEEDEINYALSKDDFINHILNGDDGFNFDFSEYKKILEIIKKIVEDADNKRCPQGE